MEPQKPSKQTDATNRQVNETAQRPESLLDSDPEMERFEDVSIEVSVQLDSKMVRVREILELQVDYVIKMGRSAGENVDLLLDGMAVGNGEIVVIEDMVGLRVTDFAVSSKKGAKD